MSRPALAYEPGTSRLHGATPRASIALLGALVAVAFAYSSPPILLGVGAAAAAAGLLAGAGRAVGAALRVSVPLMLAMIAVNALVYHRGDTVLVRGWNLPVIGTTDVTLESLVAGAAIGLRVTVVVIVFAVYSACVDPDSVLRALRPLARRSALTAALVNRLVPVTVADFGRLREAAALRGPGAEPVGRGAMARRLVAGSLDRTVDVAATLELRGHSLPSRARRERRRSLADRPLLLSAAGIAVAAVAAGLAGAGGFETYPSVEIALDGPTVALAIALPVLASLPLMRDAPVAWVRGRAPGHPDAVVGAPHA
jgi:energy-coupling factor transport system permease protein